ncbi:hypothetical protein ES703_68922 [subsurface metagenome]
MLVVDILSLYISILETILGRISIRFRRVRVGPLEFELKKGIDSSYEKTLEKIELTKGLLTDTITSIDNLKGELLQKEKELEEVTSTVHVKREELDNLVGEVELSKHLLAEKSDKLKEVLGLRRSRVVGFIGGVLASLVGGLIIWGIASLI